MRISPATVLLSVALGIGAQVVVKLNRIDQGHWRVSFPSQPGQTWAPQANTQATTNAADWFTLPSYTDDGTNVSAIVPNVPKMVFRAARKK